MSITFMTSISMIVMERYVNRETNRREKDNFTTKCSRSAIFEDSVSGVIPVAVVKINKWRNFVVNKVAL